jgi:hypothetical protein
MVSALLFSALGIAFVVMPKNYDSILWVACKYLCSSSSLNFKLFSMCPEMTWESVLMMAHCVDSA